MVVRRRARARPTTDLVAGRPSEVARKLGAHHNYATTPNLSALVAASGLSEEEVKARLAEQGYGPDIIAQLETQPMPRLVSSRVTACLGLNTRAARGE